MADLLFHQLGFDQTSKFVYSFNSTKQLNPNQSTGGQPIFPYKVTECSLSRAKLIAVAVERLLQGGDLHAADGGGSPLCITMHRESTFFRAGFGNFFNI